MNGQASNSSGSPFGASGNESPFGASGNDSPFGASGNNDNPFGADPFAIANAFDEQQQEQEAPPPAHVVPNPFGAAAAAAVAVDPFAIGNDAGHVVPNPFAFGAVNNDNDNDTGGPVVVPNPFGAAAAGAAGNVDDPFAFGNAAAAAAPNNMNAVANPFGFGGAMAGVFAHNPFGIANDEPAAHQDELDLSQHSIGETFLASHMTRLRSEQTSMLLSEEEQRWAKELKAACVASKDLNKICDMEIAQQALTHQGNVLNALLSIRALQEFRTSHDINDTPKQGIQALQALMEQQEGVFLDLDTNPQTQEPVLVMDLQAFQPHKALQVVPGRTADHNWKVLARGIYYLHKATQSSLAAVRHGLFLVVDCDGVGWENFSSEVDNRLHAELLQHLPMNWKKVMAYSTALVANVWYGLTKRLFSSQFCSKLEKGMSIGRYRSKSTSKTSLGNVPTTRFGYGTREI